MTTEQLLIEAWRQLPEHKQQEVVEFVKFLASQRRQEMKIAETATEDSRLGSRLRDIRNQIVTSGIPLLTPKQVRQEVLERRGGYQE